MWRTTNILRLFSPQGASKSERTYAIYGLYFSQHRHIFAIIYSKLGKAKHKLQVQHLSFFIWRVSHNAGRNSIGQTYPSGHESKIEPLRNWGSICGVWNCFNYSRFIRVNYSLIYLICSLFLGIGYIARWSIFVGYVPSQLLTLY